MTFGHGGNIYEMARLFNCRPALAARDVQHHLAEELILIRNCHNFQGLSDQYIRVSLKSPEANQLAAAKLRALINDVVSNPELGRMAC